MSFLKILALIVLLINVKKNIVENKKFNFPEDIHKTCIDSKRCYRDNKKWNILWKYIKNRFDKEKYFYSFIKWNDSSFVKYKLLNKYPNFKGSKIFSSVNERGKNYDTLSEGEEEFVKFPENIIEKKCKKEPNEIHEMSTDLNNKKKKVIKKDKYGIPEEKLNIRRLPNSKIKSKYNFFKVKTYNETANINYKKKKVLTINEGILKNKKLYSPDTYTRPMMSKVKESLFNILVHLGVFNFNNMNVIDAFSGSGNLGIECISRGLNNVTFVDLSLNSCKTIYENLKLCNIQHLNNKIIRSDVLELLKNPFKFDVLDKYNLGFFTPPYEQIVYSELVHSISKSELFDNDALIFIEYPKEIDMLPQKVDNLIGLRNRKFGRTYFAIYVINHTGKYDHTINQEEFYPLHYNRKQRRQEKYI
ncbi:N6-adenine-specific methylase, putative [Plasmodium vinckei brucechwatti]|uniref:N6-adenine-specific methylase, putative n=1 Tax=Plasmodium vinckei brucechwatti TaxID=119398 RepID=A0A6V7SS48_PLAVN|nr:N6-adenine-specific methylase, putative [Plasmodium vinckei brucechwatti]